MEGVSTRRVDDNWSRPWGVRVSPSPQVSRICQGAGRGGWMASWAVRWTVDPTLTCGWTSLTQKVTGRTSRIVNVSVVVARPSMARASGRSLGMDVGSQ